MAAIPGIRPYWTFQESCVHGACNSRNKKSRKNLANISPASRVLWGPACECRRLTSHKSRRLIMSIRTLMSEQKRPSLALDGAITLRPDQLERFTNPGESQSPSLQSQNLRGLDDALGMPRRM